MPEPKIATKLVEYNDWMKHTASVGRPRSRELKALDAAIQAHQTQMTKTTLLAVSSKFAAWKKSHGPGAEWKSSTRNKDKYLDLLETLLVSGADSDEAWGTVPNFMHESLINSRLGVLYLFGNLSVSPRLFNVILEGGMGIVGSAVGYAGADLKDGGLGNAAANTASLTMPTVMVPGNVILESSWDATKGAIGTPGAMATLQSFATAVRRWFQNFANKVIEEFKSKWHCELPAALVKSAINTACSATLSAATAGLISGALDLTKGTIASVDAAITKIRAWRSSKDVEFASGHPTTVVDTIHRAMWASIGEGLWTMLKGAANMGLTVAGAGAGLIAGVVIAGAEMLAKLFWRLYEVAAMGRFFGEAAEHWRNRDSADALHLQPFRFSRWYRKHVLLAPALTVLTLNSGICGDKMTYLSMFRDDASQISSAEFQRGVEHLDGLKVWGVEYLKNCGFSFSSGNDMVSRLVNFAQGGGGATLVAHQANLTGGWKVWDVVKRVAAS